MRGYNAVGAPKPPDRVPPFSAQTESSVTTDLGRLDVLTGVATSDGVVVASWAKIGDPVSPGPVEELLERCHDAVLVAAAGVHPVVPTVTAIERDVVCMVRDPEPGLGWPFLVSSAPEEERRVVPLSKRRKAQTESRPTRATGAPSRSASHWLGMLEIVNGGRGAPTESSGFRPGWTRDGLSGRGENGREDAAVAKNAWLRESAVRPVRQAACGDGRTTCICDVAATERRSRGNSAATNHGR